MKNVLIDPDARPVIAHRGDSVRAPENTVRAFDLACEAGADALEFDVRLSRDGVPVVIHDATVDRTTDGRGRVSDFTLDELRRLNAGWRMSGARAPAGAQRDVIPTLEEMLDRYRRFPILIEVKEAAAVESTRCLLERFDALPWTLVDSTHNDAVAPFRGGTLATGASWQDVVRLLGMMLVGRTPRSVPYEALCIPRWYHGVRLPVRRLARQARVAGAVTHVWTVNDPSIGEQLWTLGVQGLITDDPVAMLRLRASMGAIRRRRRG